MEERLPIDIFFRANRQAIFNVNFVADILPYFNNSLQVQLKNGQKLEMSQRQSARFKQMMGI
jgi:two-component system LytT family response regulator